MNNAPTPLVRIGVIGGGLVSQAVHLPTLTRLHSTFDVVALAEPSPSVRKTLADRYGIAHALADGRELVQCCELDAVLVASPNALHAPTLFAALERGLHCLVEKPICVDKHDIARLEAAAAASGSVVQVGYNKRFDDVITRLARDLEGDNAPILHADALTYDPGLARYFPDGALIAPGGDIPPAVIDEVRDAEREQVAAGLGVTGIDNELKRVFVDIYLGALVHDVNLLAWFGQLTGGGEMSALGSQIWPGYAGAHAWGRFDSGAPWTSAWAHTPHTHDFRESVRLLLPEGPRELELDGPYGTVKRRGTRYVRRTAGRLDRIEGADHSFTNELVAFAEAIAGGARRNTIAEAGRDISLLTDLFRLALDELKDRRL